MYPNKIRGGAAGAELSGRHSKISIGSNIINAPLRARGLRAKSNARKITLGRLLIVGGKCLPIQKTVAAQKAAFQATQKRSGDTEARRGRESFRENETENTWSPN